MTPPPLTREAREWLRDCLVRMGGSSEGDTTYQTGVRHTTEALRQKLYSMPTSSADPLDAVRARFQPKTREGCTPKLFAKAYGYLYGIIYGNSGACSAQWFEDTGASIDGKSENDLLPVSPHAALIARLNEAYITGIHDPDLYKRAADALEAIEVQK